MNAGGFYGDTIVHQLNGVEVELVNPDPDTISFPYIAMALGNINRYNGGTLFPYSVAQHSMNMARQVHTLDYKDVHELHTLQLACLLHDAHEAYVGDLTRPTRNAMSAMNPYSVDSFAEISGRVQQAIEHAAEFVGIPGWCGIVDHLDKSICVDEIAVLQPHREPLTDGREALGIEIEEWPAGEASRQWLNAFNFLQMALA